MQLPAWATDKVGPLPVWGWGALSLTGGIGYFLYKRRSTPAEAPTLTGSTLADTPAGDEGMGGYYAGGPGSPDPGQGLLGPAPIGLTPPPAVFPAPAPVVQPIGNFGGRVLPQPFDENPNKPGIQAMPALFVPGSSTVLKPSLLPPVQPAAYGSGTARSTLIALPQVNVASSVQAPVGGRFLYGHWTGLGANRVLDRATYALPGGGHTTVVAK